MRMLHALRSFFRGLCTNWIGTLGVVLTTSAFLLFVSAELLRLLGVVTNTYVGLITYLALPTLFVVGLFAIPIGWWLYRRHRGLSTRQLLSERFDPDLVAPRKGGSRVMKIVGGFTLINMLFLGIGSLRMLSFMDQPVFCGTACHRVMGPEWAAYQGSPHARVRCVDCHVGTGAEAAFDAKLNGVWQMISVTFDLFERPIPTPVHNLRPARETCERCHWPEVFYGHRLKRIVRHAMDRASTPRYTTLSLKVGSGKGHRRGEIHWHVASGNEVRYLAVDRQRLVMDWVEVRQTDGSFRRYRNRRKDAVEAARIWDAKAEAPAVRSVDCVDCHNRATHIFEDPEDAVDHLIEHGDIAQSLPYARKHALGALLGRYRPGTEQAAIAQDLRGVYRRSEPQVLHQRRKELDRAVAALQATQRRNIHPGMRVGWGVYPDHLGHRLGPGCRRCHSPDLVDDRGQAVPHDCTLCHSILAYESPRPFEFLQPPGEDTREGPMGDYLRQEFLGTKSP